MYTLNPWLDLWHIGEKCVKAGASLVEISEGMSELLDKQVDIKSGILRFA